MVGAVLGVRAIGLAADSDAECAGGACSPEGDALESSAADFATASNVAIGGGALLVVGGVLMIALAPSARGPGATVGGRF